MRLPRDKKRCGSIDFSGVTGECIRGQGIKSGIQRTEYQQLIGPGFSTNWFKTAVPMRKYSEQNIVDVSGKGFRNLRLICRADLYSYDYTATNFTWFLGNLTTVVDDCIKHEVIPIISWIHHDAEAYATEADHDAYVNWWTAVAHHLKDRDYELSFNPFTNLNTDKCKDSCNESLSMSMDGGLLMCCMRFVGLEARTPNEF